MKIQKKSRRGVKVRSGMGVGRGGWLVALLGVGVNVGYGGCEPRIKGIVQCAKMYCTILRKVKGMCVCGGGGGGAEGRGNN